LLILHLRGEENCKEGLETGDRNQGSG
jgi:hypothetical protein